MTKAAKSIFYYSFYMMGMGLSLLLIPNVVLRIFGFEPTTEVWIRVLGLLGFCAGLLYSYCGKTNQLGFFKVSVIERALFFVGMVGIVIVFKANPMLAILGSVDLLGALWTFFSLHES